MINKFRIGVSREAITKDGRTIFGEEATQILEDANVEWAILEDQSAAVTPDHAAEFDAICLMSAPVTRQTLSRKDRKLKLIARFGVGYDSVDVSACNNFGVLLTITPDGVRRPVAASVMAYVLALAHRMFLKDRLVREGRWLDKGNFLGMGLIGRTLGVIGVGNIGAEVLRLAKPFNLNLLGCDPNVSQSDIEALGATKADLTTLLKESDFVSVNCLLNEKTKGLISHEQFRLMKASAYFINTSRGPVVDESALIAALENDLISGAAIDVFEHEPVDLNNPLLQFDNVIVAPHAICHTDECMRLLGEQSFQAAVDLSYGRKPGDLVNPEVLTHPSWVDQWS
ncbi:MAG: NAD(P)-dependent oxidoreductase [Proteobacteria bacterium]|nr:NAD(P)-dependent oxidoreductase [Pseudomonadota bacterium]MDA1331641.1 NAD(P)-dependent oxidoreductase [Pseudomonadota bacterium]